MWIICDVIDDPLLMAAARTAIANRGIAYGMSQEAVIKVNEKKGYKVLSQDKNTVVVDGMQEQLKQPAKKTFYFENGRLVSVSEKIKCYVSMLYRVLKNLQHGIPEKRGIK